MPKVEISPRKRVIVRAWGDEPVLLWLHAIDNKRLTAYVGSEQGFHALGLPMSDVFNYGTLEYEQARLCYAEGNDDELSKAYSKMEHLH